MGINRHKSEEIVTKLRQVEVLARTMPFVRSVSQSKRTIAGVSSMAAWEPINSKS